MLQLVFNRGVLVVLLSLAIFTPAMAQKVFTLAAGRSSVTLASNTSTNLITTVTNTSGTTMPNTFFNAPTATGVDVTTSSVTGGTCVQTQSLANNASCTFITKFTGTAGKTGSGNFFPRFCGYGGDLCSQTTSPITVTVLSSNPTVTITGAVTTELEAQTSFEQSNPVTFTFTNSGSYAASLGFVTLSSNFSVSTNTCGTSSARVSLQTNSTCTVSGTFTPTATGPHTVEATYSFHEGTDVALSTSTTTYGVMHTLIPVPSYTGVVQNCQINATTGLLSNCTSTTPLGITEDLNAIVMNPAGTLAYVCQLFEFPQKCDIASDGSLENCSTLSDGSGATNAIFNQTGDKVFFTTGSDAGPINRCDVATDGSVSNCTNITTSGISDVGDLVFNSAHTQAYIANYSDNEVAHCSYSDSGGFSSCTTTSLSGSYDIGQIALNPAGTWLYVTQWDDDSTPVAKPKKCSINSDGSIGTCSDATASSAAVVQSVWGLSIYRSGEFAYLARDYENVYILMCTFGSTGDLTNCADAGANPIVADDLRGAFLNIV
ncbi:MAG: hypothetical protein P1U40_12975 [Coxiellaceae bacterium]|nr:hypothetical protein [Coxiellaceae bacterium]